VPYLVRIKNARDYGEHRRIKILTNLQKKRTESALFIFIQHLVWPVRLQKESDIIDDSATTFETSERSWVIVPDVCRGTRAKHRASAVQAKPRTIEKLSGAERELDNRDVAFLPRRATITQLNDVASLILLNILDFI